MFSRTAFAARSSFSRSVALNQPRRTLMTGDIPQPHLRGKEFLQFFETNREHAAHSMALWRNIFLFTGIPVLAALAVNAYLVEKEHHEHLHHHPPHYRNLPYLHIRSRPFPWGDGYRSLFHNDETQPMPPAEE